MHPPEIDPTAADPLEDFERRVTLEDATRIVHVAGRGPAVLVLGARRRLLGLPGPRSTRRAR